MSDNDSQHQIVDAVAFDNNRHAEATVDVGDYEAAAGWRQTAEDNASLETVEQLEGPDASDLDWAAWHQEQAQELEADQAEAAQAGDYEAAAELSRQAAAEHQEADALAGGSDHSYQDQLQADQMDWAVHNQELADDSTDLAASAIEVGDVDAAVYHAEQADDFTAEADYHGDLGEHGGDVSVWDPSSDVEDYGVDPHASNDYAGVDDFSTV